LGSSRDIQASALKERRQSLIEMESSLPTIGRSMTEGGEGPSVAEVPLLSPLVSWAPLKNCGSSETLEGRWKRKKRVKVLWNCKRSDPSSLSPTGLL